MQMANRATLTFRIWDYWRIVLTLAAKDIVDALKNKTTLTIILGLATMMLTVEAMPLLLKLDDRPRLAIYDAARTSLADELRRGRTVQVLEMRTEDAAVTAAQEASGPLAAVVLPPDWESSTGTLRVTGYFGHWLRAETVNQLMAEAEGALTAVAQRQVAIQPQTVYPTLENGGHPVMLAMGVVLATILITAILVPYLILEEKTAHTLELLRVSPASMNQVLLGKGVAGTLYGVLAAAVLLLFNFSLVNLWSLMLLAVLGIVLFGVGLGLLVGTVVHNEGAVQLWVGLLTVVLVFPLMFVFVSSDRLPGWAQQLMAWLPTTAAFDLVRLSFGNVWSVAAVGPKIATVLVAVVLVFLAAGWRLRRWEGV